MIVRDPDLEDLVATAHTSGVGADRAGLRRAAARRDVPVQRRRASRLLDLRLQARRVLAVRPARRDQKRDNATELELKAKLEKELPVEQDLTRWFALFDAPVLAHRAARATSACSATCSGRCSSSRRARSCSSTRSGSAGSPRPRARDGAATPQSSRPTVAALGSSEQALVLRAFALYFQLANIAEQHHRIRRLRASTSRGTRAARVARAMRSRSSTRPASATTSSGDGGERLSVELVLTAHPTEATRRTVPRERTAGSPRSCASSTTPTCRRRAERRERRDLAEEITMLWQTDEVRSQRPRVVDEIRQGLWFFEESLWDAAPELARASSRRAAAGARRLAAAVRHLDRRRPGRQPARRRRDDRGRARARPHARAALLPRARCASSRDGVGDVDDARGDRPPRSAPSTDVPSRRATPTSRTGGG